ncbi:COG4315 family predicted lipoprotein [Micromonospora sp. CB01531]|uniref:COG4315 family predicted lipoprotein n=1 Tax=Micromonospora sp. CB01531 TaxID=1718947 RepID=UPI001300E987|nr:hypothetical protein [Micromonospora sp. CB01531]
MPASTSRAPGLFVVNSQRLGGPIVIDVRGYALYRSDADRASPSRSACVGECTATWLPVMAGELSRLRVVGMDRGRLGRLVRSDGTEQLTLSGWPLYGYSGDAFPGDANGHGLNGWYVISPSGERAGRATS